MYYLHLLKGAEKEIEIGKHAVKRIKMPKDFSFSDALMHQLGAAISGQNKVEAEILFAKCRKLVAELRIYTKRH